MAIKKAGKKAVKVAPKKANPKVLKKTDTKKVVKPPVKVPKGAAKPAKSFGNDKTGGMTGAPSKPGLWKGASYEKARKSVFGLK